MTLLPLPPLPTTAMPSLPLTMLSDDEKQLLISLSMQTLRDRYEMLRAEAYYLAEQRIRNLRIAVPAEIEDVLHTVVGWASLAVDPYVERMSIDGFRLPGATDIDQDIADLWTENALDAKLPLATTDALSLGRALWLVGSPTESGGVPVATVESPLSMQVKWSTDGVTPVAGFQTYWQDGRLFGAIVKPGETVTLATNDQGQWVVVDRDQHGYDFVPIVRMPHRPRTSARSGRSAITPAIRSIIDSGCRDLMGLEVAREIFSVPGITLLGAAEADFQNADGTAKSAWETYITRVRALERDDDGNVPQIHQATVYSPEAFTKLLDMRASQMASLVAAPPQDLGLYTSGNPVSADAVGAMETRRNRRIRQTQREFSIALLDVTRMLVRFANKGRIPDELRRMELDWADIDETSMGVASDAITKQIAAGSVPATSDVVLKRLGYSAVERARLAQDRQAAQDADAAQQIIAAVQGAQTPVTTPQEPGSGNPVGS